MAPIVRCNMMFFLLALRKVIDSTMDGDVIKIPIIALMCHASIGFQFLFTHLSVSPCLRQCLPDDGLPVLEDWLTVLEGMLFAGIELAREPVDVTVRALHFSHNHFPSLLRARSLCSQDCNSVFIQNHVYIMSCCNRTEGRTETPECADHQRIHQDPMRVVWLAAVQRLRPFHRDDVPAGAFCHHAGQSLDDPCACNLDFEP